MACLCQQYLPVVHTQTFGFIDLSIYKKSESSKTTYAYNVIISWINASNAVLRTFTVPKIR